MLNPFLDTEASVSLIDYSLIPDFSVLVLTAYADIKGQGLNKYF